MVLRFRGLSLDIWYDTFFLVALPQVVMTFSYIENTLKISFLNCKSYILQYLTWNLVLWTSTKIIKIMAPESKLAPAWGSITFSLNVTYIATSDFP
jgi:hypothetical protein